MDGCGINGILLQDLSGQESKSFSVVRLRGSKILILFRSSVKSPYSPSTDLSYGAR